MKNILIVIAFVCLSSCSIEKRHYTKGFYVDWTAGKKNTLQEEAVSKRGIASDASDILVADARQNQTEQNQTASKSLSYNKMPHPYFFNNNEVKQSSIRERIKNKNKDNNYVLDKRSVETPPKKVLNGWALVSLLLLILGALFIPLFDSALVGILFMCAAIIMAAVTMEKFKQHPGKYWGKWFAKAVLLIALLILIFITAIIILVIVDPGFGSD